ncbi:hypothetical protein GOBAR_AA29916 [Gossypium barbadense]|uniref:Uncharacterized protein n=1 Tax=Gossypium barbadense TaxID=3634 RepID=A0A2P5WI67_GOSBA|nr:hypothetical protein GOBAR_AA29916 [Gossypium barbadense]
MFYRRWHRASVHSFSARKSDSIFRANQECGFSPELASRVSNFVHFETPEKPDSLIVFLENHGFSQTQIANLIKRQPTLLLSDTEKTLLPKLEFLYSIGFSRPELAKLLSSYPLLLKSSLKKQIIPSFNLLRNLFQSHVKTVKAIKRYTGVLVYDSESYLCPNMNKRGIGVPESNILMLLNCQPRALLFNPVRLKEIVEEIKRMGIDSSTKKLLIAINEAFRRYPLCMTVLEDKIVATMDFLVNKMGYSSTLIAKQPSFLTRSLEKRIMPRALFARELISQAVYLSSIDEA